MEAGTVAEEESVSGESEKSGLVRGKGSVKAGERFRSSGREEDETGRKEVGGEKGAQGGFFALKQLTFTFSSLRLFRWLQQVNPTTNPSEPKL